MSVSRMGKRMDLSGSPRRAAANLLRGVRIGVRGAFLRQAPAWLRLRVGTPIPELHAQALLTPGEPTLSFLDVLRVLDRARTDPAIAGVVLRLAGAPGGYSRVETLRRTVAAVRAAGKPVVVWSESLDTRELWLASAATHVVIPPSGSVHALGIRFEGFFLRELLERVGVKADVLRVGDFKSAAEPLTRDGYSEESRAQLEALADDIFDTIVEAVAEGRGLAASKVREHFDRGLLPAVAAEEAGLVDLRAYPDEMDEKLIAWAPQAAEGERPRVLPAHIYLRLRVADSGPQPLFEERKRVAYVTARGGIGRGRGFRGIASDQYREILDPLAENDAIAGVVLRVDSPGGEGVASDLLWRSVDRMTDRKPVVVSMGDVAASGGYFLAAGADAILAEATTLTGSIGVVGGKVDLSELYGRVGIARDSVERGSQAGLHSEARSFTPGERSALREELGVLYELFLKRVSDGRGRDRDEIHAVAQGRVWSGVRAKQKGLVDRLGGPLEAIQEVRERAGFGDQEVVPLEIHPRLPRFAGLQDLLPGGVQG